MSRIAATFDSLRRAGRTALMPYLTLGYPRRDSALDLVPALVEAGADLIELGVPFSDPLADGATIQAAAQQALDNGMSLALCLEQVAALRARGLAVPLVLMGYYNPILQMGLESFAHRAAAAGLDGLIVPDLPPEESAALRAALSANGSGPGPGTGPGLRTGPGPGTGRLDTIFLAAPTSGDARLRLVAGHSRGFLYLVSLTGVTGARNQLAPGLAAFVARARAATDLPLAVGFGIGTPAQATRVAGLADGVIVGSALVRTVGRASSPAGAARDARDFVASLRAAIDGAREPANDGPLAA